jgi:transcriptional regulator NrdR family protein
MECPACHHPKTRVIRTRPDREFGSTEKVRQCKNVACLQIFTSNETVLALIEGSQDQRVVLELVSKFDALSPKTQDTLLEMIDKKRRGNAKR